MSLSLLEYSKTILEKVSFDTILFAKEYKKAFLQLQGAERLQLKQWVRNLRTIRRW
ncbi:hypothetical protein C900_03885 [Fulvivirga imtechensis AK7]|uniref:Uncharacterized protein n=1 Tax=Fulvivirga imtechensis AK7 TaxID=1237149 RepID=L8JMZ0_9BACT|nr:hypothetical protein [Fulvivirga imtechensis]ELR70200.1 hypothetical protein C900_03885 [Fulvivirga imtechensis AK7]